MSRAESLFRKQDAERHALEWTKWTEARRNEYASRLRNIITNIDTLVHDITKIDKPLLMAIVLYSYRFDGPLNNLAGQVDKYYGEFLANRKAWIKKVEVECIGGPSLWHEAFQYYFGSVKSAWDYSRTIFTISSVLEKCHLFKITKPLTVYRVLMLKAAAVDPTQLLDPRKFTSTSIDEKNLIIFNWMAAKLTVEDFANRAGPLGPVFVQLNITLSPGLYVLPVYQCTIVVMESELCILPQSYVFTAKRNPEADTKLRSTYRPEITSAVKFDGRYDRIDPDDGQLVLGIPVIVYDVDVFGV